MARISPVHSTNPTDPDVYHECSNCQYYQQIPDRNKAAGTGGYRRCDRCTSLITQGGC